MHFIVWEKSCLRQRLHETGGVRNRYEIGTHVHTRPGGSVTDRIWYQMGSLMKVWNRTVPVSNRPRVNKVDPIPNRSKLICSCINVALISALNWANRLSNFENVVKTQFESGLGTFFQTV